MALAMHAFPERSINTLPKDMWVVAYSDSHVVTFFMVIANVHPTAPATLYPYYIGALTNSTQVTAVVH